MIIELKPGEDLQSVLNRMSNKVIVDVYTKWCGPCKMLSAQLEEFVKRHEEWSILRVDSDVHSDLAAAYHVHAVPTMHIVINGQSVEEVVGYKPLEEIENITRKY